MLERIHVFVNQFGGKYDVLYLSFFGIAFFLICSLIKSNKRRLIVSFIGSLFLVLQVVSHFFTQSFIGYQFFVHCSLKGVQSMFILFTTHIISFFLLFISSVFVFYLGSLFFYQQLFIPLKRAVNNKISNKGLLAIISVFIGIVLVKSSFIEDSRTLVPIVVSENSTFERVLAKHGMGDYVLPNKVHATKGKNLIVISLESLEKGFLDDIHKDLTPNLRALKREWNYLPLRQSKGSGWTSGSLYTSLTGFPAYFGVQGNSIFKSVYHSQITSVSHILNSAGYQLVFMNGNTNYSGVKEMLYTFQFDKIIDNRSISPTGNESTYGVRDKDLFDLAKKEIELQSKRDAPFALYLSTTDTHFPNGIYDKRMEALISNKNSDLEFMVAAVDYMVGDFISFLKEKNILENTIVYIYPDHLKMGDPSLFENTGHRDLYIITNASTDDLKIENIEEQTQIDLPKITLNGLQVKHNVKFFTDYISEDKNTFIQENIQEITEINSHGILRIGSEPITIGPISPNYLKYKKDTLRYIAHAGGKIEGLTYTNSLEALNLSYKKGFRLFELDIIKTSDGQFVAAHDWEYWSKTTRYLGEIPASHEQFLNYKIHDKFTPLDINKINKWFSIHTDAILVTDKVNTPIEFAKVFIDPKRLIMELFDMEALTKGLKANIKSAMPSQSLIKSWSKEEVVKFKNMGVKNIAVSRQFIPDNMELLKFFKSKGINAYVFGLYVDAGYNEDYVAKYEMDIIYGVYADDWSFE